MKQILLLFVVSFLCCYQGVMTLYCPADNGVYRFEYDCRYYVLCKGRTPHLMKCPTGFFFNPSLRTCDYGDC
ncbi:endochitinase-like [Tachypleus tridentatus]|uniref:endochitinase-like n=1 Tax=Tachypleus tridentatus TaxID=6853 RepID=UPI003FD59D9B